MSADNGEQQADEKDVQATSAGDSSGGAGGDERGRQAAGAGVSADPYAALAEVHVLADEIDLPPPASVPPPRQAPVPTILPAAEISHVTPAEGFTSGNERVTLEGEHLHRESIVRFDGVLASTIGAGVRGRQLSVLTPPRQSPGLVNVSVQNPGARITVAEKAFRYLTLPAPEVISVAPTRGGVTGGTEVSITGKSFVVDSLVIIDGKEHDDFVFIDTTTIEVRMPPGKHGRMVDVGVRNPGGKESVVRRAFMYDERYG